MFLIISSGFRDIFERLTKDNLSILEHTFPVPDNSFTKVMKFSSDLDLTSLNPKLNSARIRSVVGTTDDKMILL